MPQFSVSVPHSLSQQEAQERLKDFAEKMRQHYTDMVQEVRQEWQGETLAFGLKTFGMQVDGNLAVGDNAIDIQGSLPMTAMLFKGQIESALKKEISNLLS